MDTKQPSPLTRAIQNSGLPKGPSSPIAPTPRPVSPVYSAANVPAELTSSQAETARRALSEAYDTLQRASQAEVAVLGDQGLTEQARDLEAFEVREAAAQKVEESLSVAFQRAMKHADAVEASITSRTPGRTVDPREVRDYVRGLKPEARLAFIMNRAAAGDLETVHAVTTTAPYLSGTEGIDPKRLAQIRETVYRHAFPDDWARVVEARRIRDVLQHAYTAAVASMPPETAAIQKARAQRARRLEAIGIK